MAPKIKIPVRRTGRALAHLHSKPSPHMRLVPHFAGALRSPQIKMRFAHGAIRTSAHLRRASVLRSKTLAEGEFISPEHYNFLKGIQKKKVTTYVVTSFFGAGDEARTRYLHLGKVALYQMSYARGTLTIIADSFAFVKPYFSFFRRFWFCRLANAEKL